MQGVDRADKTLKNVKGGWGRTRSLHRHAKVVGYKVTLKVTFVLTE